MWIRPNSDRLALRILLITLSVNCLVEAVIMAILALRTDGSHNRWLDVVVDSVALTLVVAPLLYWLVARPLRTLADERSRLLAHAFDVQEAERRRIARDLHDEIGQSFTSLLVRLRLLDDASTLDEARQQIEAIREQSGQIYDQIRGLARGLHPTVLDDLGLAQALQRLAEDYETAHGITIDLRLGTFEEERLTPKLRTAVYRIVQESLTNCVKHSQATEVVIYVDCENDEVLARVTDDGRGFDPDDFMSAPMSTTFGLASMRERAMLVHGSLEIRSQPGCGTTIALRAPIKN